jgi:hypothetical protein
MQNLFTRQGVQARATRIPAKFCLKAGETRALKLQRPVFVRVRSGLVWLTVEQGGGDFWLRPGQDFEFHGSGLAVMEAVNEDAEFELRYLPGALRRWFTRLTSGLRRSGRARSAPGTAMMVQATEMEYQLAAEVNAQDCQLPCASGAPRVSIRRLLPSGLIRWH